MSSAISTSSAIHRRYEREDPDVRLMLRVRDDDAGAFEELVARYQSRLISVLEHLTPGRDLAEDLAQEVFLRVYRSRKRYKAGAKFSTWLFTIANNVASNARRAQGRKREVAAAGRSDAPDAQVLEQMAQAASGTMPSRVMAKAERAEIVRLAVEALNERQRMALLLAKFEGLSYAEIAEAMGLSVPAVKSLLTRARENLRMLLEPYIAEGETVRSS